MALKIETPSSASLILILIEFVIDSIEENAFFHLELI
jgi:hypothetical protein